MLRSWLRENPILPPLFLVILITLLLISHYNYILFHTVVELFCVLVACAVFIIAWNARWRTGNHFLLVLGTGFACSASLDLLHALAYPGLSVFSDSGENLTTQLWVAARLAEASGFLLAPLFLNRRIKPWILLLNGAGITGLFTVLIFLGIFPATYASATLTPFALGAEAAVIVALALSVFLLQTRGEKLDKAVRSMLLASILLTMGQEVMLTYAADMNGLTIVTGYFLKLLSCFFVYKAVLETGLREPQRILFMELERGRRLLSEAESRFRSISDGAPVGIFRSTPEGCLEYANPALAQLYGYDSPADLMTSITSIGTQLHVDQARYATMRKRLENDSVLTGFQAHIRRKDGTTIWTSREISAHHNLQGKLTGFDGFVTDISDGKMLESMRLDVDRVLRHDLKAPLISLTSGLAVVRATCTPDHRGEIMIREMERSSMQMLALIDLSAGLYKMEMGDYELDLERVNLLDLLHQAINEQRTLIERKDVFLRLLLDGEEPVAGVEFPIMAEPALSQVAISNLLCNAVQAAPDGESVTLELCSAPLRLTLRNAGEVPEEIRDHFFEKYATCGKENGTGLGTYSAKLIAKTHGWTVTMSTGRGVTSVRVEFGKY